MQYFTCNMASWNWVVTLVAKSFAKHRLHATPKLHEVSQKFRIASTRWKCVYAIFDFVYAILHETGHTDKFISWNQPIIIIFWRFNAFISFCELSHVIEMSRHIATAVAAAIIIIVAIKKKKRSQIEKKKRKWICEYVGRRQAMGVHAQLLNELRNEEASLYIKSNIKC